MTLDMTAQHQADTMWSRYGIRAEAHGGNVVVRASEYEQLRHAVMTDPLLGPVGRGFYLGNGNIVVAPDWTFDAGVIARARFIAVVRIEWRRALRRWGMSR